MLRKKNLRLLFFISCVAICYGVGRLYFHLSAGFSIDNISSDFSYNPEWNVRDLTKRETESLNDAINQTYTYFGKGCQSYAFLSQDGEYVIKFFKCQKFRLLPWLAYAPPLPAIVQYRNEKMGEKREKLNEFAKSWKTVFENLKDETALVYVHLNKTQHLKKTLVILDNMGISHSLDLDQMEFCIQRRGEMLCSVLLNLKKEGKLRQAKTLVDNLLNLVLSEYHRGFADNDHALMQNTGVTQGLPIHIDVGQFFRDDDVKNPAIHHQELYTKTYYFHSWLRENYPEVAVFLEGRLIEIIGPAYSTMKPQFRKK
jgi:hypothetical protein